MKVRIDLLSTAIAIGIELGHALSSLLAVTSNEFRPLLQINVSSVVRVLRARVELLLAGIPRRRPEHHVPSYSLRHKTP